MPGLSIKSRSAGTHGAAQYLSLSFLPCVGSPGMAQPGEHMGKYHSSSIQAAAPLPATAQPTAPYLPYEGKFERLKLQKEGLGCAVFLQGCNQKRQVPVLPFQPHKPACRGYSAHIQTDVNEIGLLPGNMLLLTRSC